MEPESTDSRATNESLRIAIIGDPHFVVADHELASGSHLKIDTRGHIPPKQSNQHPWASLSDLVSKYPDAALADIVVCVGDLSSGGDKVALESGWRHLNELANSMKAKLLACATGNHDVLSRSQAKEVLANPIRNLGLPRGLNENLKRLAPPYPLVDLANTTGQAANDMRTQYFGNNFVLVSTPQFRVVVLNSCSDHTANNFDYEKGAFPGSTREALLEALKASHEPKLNVLVCHHPPTSHGYYGENNYDFISNGGELLTALEEHGAWLVVHGHKHHSHLSYAPGGGRSPVVFAASSLGAHLEQQGRGFRNQFFIVELDATRHEDLRGIVRAWDWHAGMGFHHADRKNGGIFDGCGFGCRQSPGQIAETIKTVTIGKLPMRWDQLRREIPELAFVIPAEYPLIDAILKRKYSIVVEADPINDNWVEVARAAL